MARGSRRAFAAYERNLTPAVAAITGWVERALAPFTVERIANHLEQATEQCEHTRPMPPSSSR